MKKIFQGLAGIALITTLPASAQKEADDPSVIENFDLNKTLEIKRDLSLYKFVSLVPSAAMTLTIRQQNQTGNLLTSEEPSQPDLTLNAISFRALFIDPQGKPVTMDCNNIDILKTAFAIVAAKNDDAFTHDVIRRQYQHFEKADAGLGCPLSPAA